MGEHAPLPPSGAPQWGNCSGSIVANAMALNIDTDASRAGTAAHWVLSEALQDWRKTLNAPVCADWLGGVAPNDVIIDEEMAEGAQVMVDDVLEVIHDHKLNNSKDLMIEHRVHAPQIHEHNWGTLDCALDLRRIGLIYLWDYKHGHREVPVWPNLQLIDYMAGLIHDLGIDGYEDQGITVVFRIVHPYCYAAEGAVSEHRVPLSDLRPYLNQLHAKALEAMTSPSLSAGPWCRDCASVGTCATARKHVYDLFSRVNEPFEIDQMSGAALAAERGIVSRGLVVAKARLEAIEADLEHRVSNGATDTGLALANTSGRLKWSVPVDQAVALGAQFGFDIAIAGVMTPTQAKAAAPLDIRAGFSEVMKGFAHNPAGKMKLIDAEKTVSAKAFARKN